MMCSYVTGFEELFKSNQIDSVIEWVSWFQVSCKEIKSNAVSKLFILVWYYEGMKVLDLGYENSYENFSITPICHIFSNFPAVFHHAQVTNRQVLKHGFTQLRRTAHMLLLEHFKQLPFGEGSYPQKVIFSKSKMNELLFLNYLLPDYDESMVWGPCTTSEGHSSRTLTLLHK